MKAPFFAAYSGPSMKPTLPSPALMEIMPYGNTPICIGDVILFANPDGPDNIVHRVVKLTPAGCLTRGDNNSQLDKGIIAPAAIAGRVVAVWQNQRRRSIAGGRHGLVIHKLALLRKTALKLIMGPLYNFLIIPYDKLVKLPTLRRLIRALLRDKLCPRVTSFNQDGTTNLSLMLGSRIVGRFDRRLGCWKIRRFVYLLIDPATLPGIE